MSEHGAEVAYRVLKKGTEDVRISIFKPVEISADEWHCHFAVSGLEVQGPLFSIGHDSVQALLLVIEAIRLVLVPHEKILTWECGPIKDFGFPRSIPQSMGDRFYESACAQLDQDVAMEVQRLREKNNF